MVSFSILRIEINPSMPFKTPHDVRSLIDSHHSSSKIINATSSS